jgi:hypothetical protein
MFVAVGLSSHDNQIRSAAAARQRGPRTLWQRVGMSELGRQVCTYGWFYLTGLPCSSRLVVCVQPSLPRPLYDYSGSHMRACPPHRTWTPTKRPTCFGLVSLGARLCSVPSATQGLNMPQIATSSVKSSRQPSRPRRSAAIVIYSGTDATTVLAVPRTNHGICILGGNHIL